MNQKPDIQELLQRYWEGETSLEEERWLKAFFANGPVPEQFQREAQLFLALRAEQNLQMPAKREQPVPMWRNIRLRWTAAAAILALLASWWLVNPTPNHQNQTPRTATAKMPAKKPKTIAPEVASLTTTDTSPKQIRKQRPHVSRPPATIKAPDTYEDPEAALAEIKAVLALVSHKINKSKKELDKGLQEVETVDILFKKKKEING